MLRKRKACPQILILIDVMMLLLFVYITQPQAQSDGQLYIDYNQGLIKGSKIVLKNKQNETLAYFVKKLEFEQTSEILKAIFNGVECPKEICKQYIHYSKPYEVIHLYLPTQIMATAYQLFHTSCVKTNCNGKIYINASTGNSAICAKEGHYQFILKKKLVKGKACIY